MDSVRIYFLWFMVYSMTGWIYESILCSVSKKQLINRGFLNGPYCPVYGFGAVLIIFFLNHTVNVFVLFFAGIFLTCSLEYVTSWILEKVFHTRWWDYSERKLNVNGRICLLGAIVFGTFSVVLILYIHPFVVSYINKIPEDFIDYIGTILFTIIVVDLVYTITKFNEFQKRIKRIHIYTEQAKAYAVKMKDIINERNASSFIQERISELSRVMNYQEKRLLKAFPRLTSIDYNEIVNKIRNRVEKIQK